MKITFLVFALMSASVWAKPAETLAKLHMEIAQVLSEARKAQGSACGEIEVYQETIVDNVREAFNYVELERRPSVPGVVLEQVGDSITFKEVIGQFRPFQPTIDNVEAALPGVTMYGPSRGVFGNTTMIRFQENGKLFFDQMELLDAEPWTRWKTFSGTYKVSLTGRFNDKIHVEVIIDGGAAEVFVLKPSSGWPQTFQLSPAENPEAPLWEAGYTDFPSECDA